MNCKDYYKDVDCESTFDQVYFAHKILISLLCPTPGFTLLEYLIRGKAFKSKKDPPLWPILFEAFRALMIFPQKGLHI